MTKKKGGLLGSLRDLVVEDDTKKEAPEAPAGGPVFGTAVPGTPFPAGPGAPTFTPTYSYTPQATADPQLVAEVESQLAGASSAEYTKFGALLAQMSQIPDERLRFTTALNVASTTLGMDPAAIRRAFEGRVTTLDQIEAKFRTQSQAVLNEKTQQAQAELTRLQGDLERRTAELERLRGELTQVQAQQAATQAKLVSDQQEIESVRQNMQAALAAVRAKVTTERDTVLRNIGG